jgi:predicted histone-like DNA-binding protein
MAIVFDWYENPNASSEEEAALHPRIFMNGKVDTDTLCYKIHDYSSLTVGDVKNVLDNLSKILGESLREGKEVHIEGIGYFYPTLAATGKVTRSTPHKTNKVASKSDMELITRRVIKELEGDENKNLDKYATTGSPEYEKMVDVIRERFGLSSLKFNTLETLVEAIGLPKCKICTHCFDGSSHF